MANSDDRQPTAPPAGSSLGPQSDVRRRVAIALGDITQQAGDAIVNAADNALLGGGGVDGAIHRAAGPALLEACRALGGCPTGEAKLTRGYKLPVRYVIHTVGPVWYGGSRNEPELLARCYRRCLELAVENGCQTIAFPAIGTGIYGYPLTPATRIAIREVIAFLRQSDAIDRVTFVCFDRITFQTYNVLLAQALGAVGSGPISYPGGDSSGKVMVPQRPSNPPHLSTLERTRLAERILGGLWGAVVGDALGVPVEFQLRSTLDEQPVIDMRGFGTYNVPPGTWSDDSSLLLCTLYSLIGRRLDTADLAQRFVRFLDRAYMTPAGEVFDIGIATATAIDRMKAGVPPEEAGGAEDSDNGNGSLMRILPVALRFYRESDTALVEYAHRASALTHRHPRSKIACGYACVLAKYLLEGDSPLTAYVRANDFARSYYTDGRWAIELPQYGRVLGGRLAQLPREVVPSTGYVVHTLEASLWCLLTTRTYEEAVLRAVNLGGDTDTTACVTGGWAGLHYSLGQVPSRWRQAIARAEDLEDLFARFVARMLAPAGTD
jgi:ADP-ribosylglycohydrolase/O-acetyl-ADP-ribose deacetylase (regulator of RNase III)